MKKVWIVAPFSSIENVGVRNRFQYLARRLYDEGIDVTLFTSNFSHRKKEHIPEDIIDGYPYNIELIEHPSYSKNVSLKRIFGHIKFALNLKTKFKTIQKPDIIYSAYPTMSGAYVSGIFAKKNNIRFFLDVQDTWPESISAAINTDKLLVRILMWPFTKFADKIYSMPDIVFGVSKSYVDRARVKNSKAKEFISVYIGTDLEKFDKAAAAESNINLKDEINLIYVGTLSHSYDIDTIIITIEKLKQFPNIRLNILGAGPDEERLISLSKKMDLYNKSIFFHGFLQYEDVASYLKMSDIALNSLTSGSKGTITNKLGDYLSAGLPILNSCKQDEVIDLVIEKNIGVNYEPGDSEGLKAAILELADDREKMKIYSKNSRALAEKYFDRKESYKPIISKIKN